MKELLIECDGLNQQGGSVWLGGGGGSSALAIPLEGRQGGNKAAQTIDRQVDR